MRFISLDHALHGWLLLLGNNKSMILLFPSPSLLTGEWEPWTLKSLISFLVCLATQLSSRGGWVMTGEALHCCLFLKNQAFHRDHPVDTVVRLYAQAWWHVALLRNSYSEML